MEKLEKTESSSLVPPAPEPVNPTPTRSEFSFYSPMGDLKDYTPSPCLPTDAKPSALPEEEEKGESIAALLAEPAGQRNNPLLGFHTFDAFDNRFVIPKLYIIEKVMGKGAYGLVCRAEIEKTKETVAIKKLLKAFKNKDETKRTLREIKLLKFFDHENVISIRTLLNPVSLTSFDSFYIVTDFMESDLGQIIASNNSLSEAHHQYILFQILCALKYIHSANVIHRDLKPGNILINGECDIKICDFGLARAINPRHLDMT